MPLLNNIKNVFSMKNFFTKLLVTYLIIISITLLVLGLFLGQLFQSYFYSERQSALVTEGQEINNLFASFINGELSYLRLKDQLTSIDRVSKAQIWIVDKDGLILQTSGTTKKDVQGTKLEKTQLDQILRGQTVMNITSDQAHFNSTMMSVYVPLIINRQVQGATVLHTSVISIQKSLMVVYGRIVIAALVSIVVAFILIYFISKKLSEPIREMTRLSLAMAGGDFSNKVAVTSNDEVGQLSATFNYMVSELGKLEQMRRDFIANVSHELRSPLTSIRGFVQGVLDGTVDQEEQGKYLQIALEETNRLNRLVNDLLELARMEAGNYHLEMQPFMLKELIQKVMLKMSPQVSEKDITIKENTPESLMVLADGDRIEQVLINLLDNAIRFSKPQGQIDLLVEKIKNKVSISVKDSGAGIPDNDLENIWGRFYKCDKARTRTKGGTGLGLAIVKHLIKAHGEDINVKSQLEKGTTFTFTLPLSNK